MVITAIIFLISLPSETHFCKAEKEWCEGALASGRKPPFWQENRDTSKMSNYGWGGLGGNAYREFPCCLQSAWSVGLKASLGFLLGCWESFSHGCQSPERGTHGVVLMHALGELCRVQIQLWFLEMSHRPPPKSR